MKTPYLPLAALALLSFSASVFAINTPIVEGIPTSVDAKTYTLTIYTEEGAKVNVVGGPGDIAPVTDGAGSDPEDGEVQITVGLAQNTTNTFSINVEKNGDVSDTVIIEIVEKSVSSGGDETPPAAPVLGGIPDIVDAAEFLITGDAEPNSNIYAYTTSGIVAGSTAADEDGKFQVLVELEENKTNRFNITAEDEAGNESNATQAVIRQTVDNPDEPVEEEEPELETSAQQFFNDISGHWAEDFINDLYQREVVSGKSEGIFDPNGLITRAELTKIAMLAFGHSVNTTVDEHPFQDVPKNAWFAPYVEEAERLEVVSGYPSGGFGPNDFITRAAALKIILEAAERQDIDSYFESEFGNSESTYAVFPDVPKGAWFAKYVVYAGDQNVVGGYSNGNFGPGDKITRAQVAKIVINVLNIDQ